jgi:hypothetical protein
MDSLRPFGFTEADGFDVQGFEAATLALVPGGHDRSIAEQRFEEVGIVLMDLLSGGLFQVFERLRAGGRFPAAVETLLALSRLEARARFGAEELLAARVRALRRFGRVLICASRDRMNAAIHAAEERERRAIVRARPREDDDIASGTSTAPVTHDELQELADRVIEKLETTVSPRALAALRVLLAARGELTACEAAARCGTSPAAVTRARDKLRHIADRELDGLPDAVRMQVGHVFRESFERCA